MKRVITKDQVGKFGKIVAGDKGYKKTLHGKILYVDYFGGVIFVDNEDIAHRFQATQVDSFDEMEFKDTSK